MNEECEPSPDVHPLATRQDSVADSLFASAMVDFEDSRETLEIGEKKEYELKEDAACEDEEMRDATPDVTTFQEHLMDGGFPLYDAGKSS